jgi:hypothetical protein
MARISETVERESDMRAREDLSGARLKFEVQWRMSCRC